MTLAQTSVLSEMQKSRFEKKQWLPAFDKIFDSFSNVFMEKFICLLEAGTIQFSIPCVEEDGKLFFPDLRSKRTKEVPLMTL